MLRTLVCWGNGVNHLLIVLVKELSFQFDLSILNRRIRFLLVELAGFG